MASTGLKVPFGFRGGRVGGGNGWFGGRIGPVEQCLRLFFLCSMFYTVFTFVYALLVIPCNIFSSPAFVLAFISANTLLHYYLISCGTTGESALPHSSAL